MKQAYTLLIAMLSLSGIANAQADHKQVKQEQPTDFMSDAEGRVYTTKVSFETEGSPYFLDEYNNAQVTTASGNVYNNVKVKISLLDNTVLFLSKDGKEMLAGAGSIKKIAFSDSNIVNSAILVNGMPDNGRMNSKTFYQLLEDGNMQLLKYFEVSYRDDRPHTTATITRIFEKKERYFVNVNGVLTSVKKVDDLIALMGAKKQNDVQAYIEKNKLKIKREADLRQVISYYNSLFK